MNGRATHLTPASKIYTYTTEGSSPELKGGSSVHWYNILLDLSELHCTNCLSPDSAGLRRGGLEGGFWGVGEGIDAGEGSAVAVDAVHSSLSVVEACRAHRHQKWHKKFSFQSSYYSKSSSLIGRSLISKPNPKRTI